MHTYVVFDAAAAAAAASLGSGAATGRDASPPEPGPALLAVFSFYELSDSVAKGKSPVRAAMAFYNAPFDTTGRLSATDLVGLALHAAHARGCHSYYMLDALDNSAALAPLRFKKCGADGALRYFVYNYALPSQVPPDRVGLVLM